jgi:hypothetical protein
MKITKTVAGLALAGALALPVMPAAAAPIVPTNLSGRVNASGTVHAQMPAVRAKAAATFSASTTGSSKQNPSMRRELGATSTATANTHGVQGRANAQEKLAALKERAKTKSQHKWSDKVKNHVTQALTRLQDRTTRAVDRLTNVSTRLDTRLNMLSSQGIDVSAARADLAQAETALEAASSASAELSVYSGNVFSADLSAQDVAAEIKTTVTEIRNSLKEARTDLLKAVADARAEVESHKGLNASTNANANAYTSGTTSAASTTETANITN